MVQNAVRWAREHWKNTWKPTVQPGWKLWHIETVINVLNCMCWEEGCLLLSIKNWLELKWTVSLPYWTGWAKLNQEGRLCAFTGNCSIIVDLKKKYSDAHKLLISQVSQLIFSQKTLRAGYGHIMPTQGKSHSLKVIQ